MSGCSRRTPAQRVSLPTCVVRFSGLVNNVRRESYSPEIAAAILCAVDCGFINGLRAGKRLVGTIVGLPSPEIAEIMAGAGFDWLFIDAEHGPIDPLTAQRMLQAAGRCPCIVRVPAADEAWLKKVLDIGAAGVLVPQVRTASEVERVVERCRYAPQGVRGIGAARAHAYGARYAEYAATANETVAVIVQAENREAIDNIEAIASVPGVDAVFVGPYDLSASFGKLAAVDDAEVVGAIRRVRDVCRQRSVALGAFAATPDAARPLIADGFNLIAVGADTSALVSASRAVVDALKNMP